MKKGFRKSPPLSVYPRDICFIYKLGIPNILMQSAYTFYILGLNLILATFSDQAVTVLGLYYKWQAFFFIPLGALQTCIVPVISYNYASGRIDRCKKTLSTSLVGGMGLMFIGTLVFNLIPGQMLRVFTSDPQVIAIGTVGFHFVGISFIPMAVQIKVFEYQARLSVELDKPLVIHLVKAMSELLKKSTSLARRSLLMAAAGVSIMMPIWTSSL
jgi:Na+-driven multidrug efflux pump